MAHYLTGRRSYPHLGRDRPIAAGGDALRDLAKLASLVGAPDFRILLQAKIGPDEAGALISTVQEVAEEAKGLFAAIDDAEALFAGVNNAAVAGVLVRRDEPDIEIVATVDMIPAHALLDGAELQPDGRLEVSYIGQSDVQWNEQATVRTCSGARQFVDARGGIVPEADIALRLPDGEILAPALRVTSVPVE